MAETHFTPGPWHYIPGHCDDDGAYFEGMVWDETGHGLNHHVAVIRVGLPGTEANGRLIAAAPDLLDALLRFVHWYDTDATEEARDDAYYEAQHAICKALGERATANE